MLSILPKWLDKRYVLIAKQFGTDSFSFTDAEGFLKKNFGDSPQMSSLILSGLKKANWLKIELDPTDSRKRKYEIVMMYTDSALKRLAMEIRNEAR